MLPSGGSSVGAGGAGAPYSHAVHWSPPEAPHPQFLAMNKEEEEEKIKKEEGKERKKKEDGKLGPSLLQF